MAKTRGNNKSRGKNAVRGRMPSKTYINLARVEEKKINIGGAFLGILLILVLAGAFAKFLVYDRLMEMSTAEAEVTSVRSQLEKLETASENLGDVEESYAHYTYAGMTADEMALVDRVLVLELVESVLPRSNSPKNWSLSGNVLTIELTENSLSKQNELAAEIEKSPIVDSCVIMTANKNETKTVSSPSSSNTTQYLRNRNTTSSSNTGKEVWARFLVYLKQPDKEDAE